MTLASQFRGDIQAETLSNEGADKPAVSLAQQFSSAPLADSVGRSLNAAKNTTPDRTLSAIKLSEQTGLPLDAVERNHDQILVDVKQRETDPIEIARGNPSLARWLANPNNAALGQNDVGILKRIESAIPDPALMMDPGRQFTSEVVRLPGTVLSGTGSLLESTTRMVDRLTFGSISNLDQFLQRHVGRPPDWADPTKALRAAGQPFKEGAAEIAVPEERQNLVTDISGAIGQLSTQVVQAYVAPQTLAPSLLAQGADIQAERVQQQGAAGTPESDAAILTGAGVTALLEKIGIGQLINRLPPQIKNGFLRGAADIVTAGGIEAGQELVENIAQNVITQQLINPEQQIIDGDTWREVTAAGGAAAFLRAVIQAATRGRSREQGQKDQKTLDSIVEANDQTWLKQNAPDKLQEFIAGAKQAGADTVYIPVEAATTYFQTANLDMNQVLAAAGVDRQDILAAQATGGDIPIPIEIYTVALSEHHKAGLREIARINPEASAPAEAQDAEAERQNIDAEVRRIFDAAQEDAPGKIKEDVVSQLIAIGQDADTADKYGTLIDKAFTTIGRRSGIEPAELYNRYRLKITRESMEGISDLSLQTGRPSITLSQYSPDEVEFFRSMGIPVEQKTPARPSLPDVVAIGPTSFKATPINVATYRETDVFGAEDLIISNYANAPYDVTNIFVADDPELAIGQGENKGVKIKFRPGSISGAVNAKPGAGIIGGQEYKANAIARDAIDEITLPKKAKLRSLASKFLQKNFEKTAETKSTVTYSRKGISSEPKSRPELPATENLVTVGGGAPRAGWAESTGVMGADGRPAAVYRGSRDGTTTAADFAATGAATGHPSAGLGVWLSADRGDAARYGTVGEYQLDLRNPKVYSIEDFPGFDSIEESRALREQLQAQGHDGVVIDTRNVGGPVQFVVFSPESVIPARVFAQSDPIIAAAERGALSAYNSSLPSVEDQIESAKEWLPSGYSYEIITADDAESIFGDREDWPPELASIIDVDGVAVEVATPNDNKYFKQKEAPAESDFWSDVISDEGGVILKPINSIDDIFDSERMKMLQGNASANDAVIAFAEAFGYEVSSDSSSPTSKYYTLSKGDVRLGLRVSDHAKTSQIGHATRGKADVHINMAPTSGGRDNALFAADDFDSFARKLLSAESDEDGSISFAGKPASLFQKEGVERGQIRIAPSGVEIRLFEKANLSTFLHEGGHLFLELLGDIATNPDAPQQIKDDYAAALKWLGVESRDQVGVEQHEKWARGFESYLGEGKAPSPELAGIFSRFRAWMIAIYKSLKNLNVELSDEVRGVFDRLIATDEEISAAQPLGFQTQEESGMTDKQWLKYQELLTEARAETEGQLTARAYGEIKREKEAWWKERMAEVSAEVEAEANEMPVYQAWSFLAEGKYPDGREYDGNLERQKLDKSVLLSMYGQEFLNKTLRYKHVYQQEGGHHPSLVASQFGYESASIMIEQLAAVPKKSEYVANESRRRMLEQYGDILNDGSLPEQAVKAAHNDRRFKAIEVELEALGRLIGRTPPKVAQLRQLADNMIGDKKAREIQPYLYLKAERKAAKDYAELAAKGQRAQAYEAKQRQLLNGLLYDRAWKAKEEVDQIREYANGLMKKPKQEKLAKAGGSYLQQINDILAAYQFRKLPLKQVDRQENLRQWVDRMQEEGDITAVPDEVIRRVESSPTNYQNASLNELRGVRDALKNIDHLSKLKNKLLKGQELRDKDEARDEMLGRLKETHPNRKTLAASEFAKTNAEQMGDSLKGLADALWRPETIIEAMDGGESGPWHDYLWEPANQARAVQNQLREKVGVPLEELAKSLDSKWQSALDDEWQIAGRKMTRRDIIGMALNLGNDGNRDKLMRGGYIADGVRRQYTNEDIESAISHLTSQDWSMIQTVWDTVNSLWPDIVAQQQRLSGLPPEKIESTPFVVNTADGQAMTMRGGYFPLAYDPRQSQAGEKQASSENAADALLSGQYSRAATPKGHLKERTGYAAPIQLDYQAVLTRHMDDVITDLSHREFLKQAQWIVSDTQIKNSMMERIGETGYKALRGFIGHTVGADRPIPDSSAKAWQRVSDQIIANTAVYALGFRAVTAWGNLAVAPIQAAARVKPQYMVRGFTQFYSNLRESTDFIHNLSPFMRNRARDLDASYVEVMNTLGGNKSIRRQIARASMQVHRWADYLATHGIWLGRYQQAVDSGAQPEEAARLADKAIRQTQTAGAPKDLSGVERDPTFKMFRLFIGPMLIMNNRIRESVTKKGVIDTWPEALGTMMAAWFLPAIIFELAVGRGPEEDDEPEDWYKWMATKVGMYPMQTIPLVRDIAATAEAQILGEYRQVRAAPIAEAGNAVVKAFATTAKEIEAADEIEDIDAGKVSKDTLRALGPIFGLPTNQVDVTGSFIFDVMTKEYEPDSPLDYRYLLVRRPKEEQ